MLIGVSLDASELGLPPTIQDALQEAFQRYNGEEVIFAVTCRSTVKVAEDKSRRLESELDNSQRAFESYKHTTDVRLAELNDALKVLSHLLITCNYD